MGLIKKKGDIMFHTVEELEKAYIEILTSVECGMGEEERNEESYRIFEEKYKVKFQEEMERLENEPIKIDAAELDTIIDFLDQGAELGPEDVKNILERELHCPYDDRPMDYFREVLWIAEQSTTIGLSYEINHKYKYIAMLVADPGLSPYELYYAFATNVKGLADRLMLAGK